MEHGGDAEATRPCISEDTKSEDEEKKTENAEQIPPAPEGGWGWLIVVAIAVNRLAVWGALPFFSIIFVDVVTLTPGAEGSAVTLIVGIFFLFVEIVGILFPALNRKFSLRVTGTAGGIIFALGTVSAIFVNTLTELAISYGFVQGVGYGLILSSSMTAFNEHFRRRRTTAMATAQFSTSVLAVGLPHAVQAARELGGVRGVRLVVVGLGLATALCQLFVRNAAPAPAPASVQKLQKLLSAPAEDKVDAEVTGRVEDDLETPLADEENIHTKQKSCWRRLLGLLGLDQPALRAARVWGPAAGLAVSHVGHSSFFALLPLHFTEAGLSKERVTDAIAAANIGDAAGRLALIVLGLWLGSRNRHVFAVAGFSTAVCLLGIAWLPSWPATLTLSVLLGAARGLLYVALFLGLAEVVAPPLFPAAMALYFFFVIVISILLAPLIGLVRDATRSYPACFCFVAALMALYPVAWGTHELVRRCIARRSRHQPPAEDRSLSDPAVVVSQKELNGV